ncbi:hypothetical protein DUNSADRAFT_8740 [Dunaliella salina]|uniref:Uncharacterized protein n=1 Tax=Dunaliella salina TaxID=3046 RepID=A0ABQ7GIY5_DUNSA|nr:hypothetical protein DUNSADRAFT_8740 [Dunaliella salina]|eukprot:KAF5834573.1 hypothetical protein DUNSADRAFT_8740 [Dunaliella salina]
MPRREEGRKQRNCRRNWPVVFPIVFGSLWLCAVELLWIFWGVSQSQCNFKVQAEVTNLTSSPTYFGTCDVAIEWACPAEQCDHVFSQNLNFPAPYCLYSQQQGRGQLVSGCVKAKHLDHFIRDDDHKEGNLVVIPARLVLQMFVAALVVTIAGAPILAGLIAWAVFKVRHFDARARAQEGPKEQAMSALSSSEASDGHVCIRCKSTAPQPIGAQEEAEDESSDSLPLLQNKA